ncbi:hypothetical protein [Shewanella fidelis]|uniref:hypothetical protein n=1 Tax=Shewanella fidelis TaxID=173509 RepID=UPI0012EB43EB|nr:hypothetical protein [Shewanella fidelis]
MRNIIIGTMLSLIVFGVSATQPPVVVPPPEPYLACSLEQVVELEAEFDIPKFKRYQIPKGERFRKCFKLVGHSDEVGLLVVRTSVTDNDKITIEEGPYKGEPSLAMQEASREVFNLSRSFNAVRQDQILYPIFSSEVSTTQDREIIFGYELSSNGTFLLTVAMTTDDPIRYVPNKDETRSSSIPVEY